MVIPNWSLKRSWKARNSSLKALASRGNSFPSVVIVNPLERTHKFQIRSEFGSRSTGRLKSLFLALKEKPPYQ